MTLHARQWIPLAVRAAACGLLAGGALTGLSSGWFALAVVWSFCSLGLSLYRRYRSFLLPGKGYGLAGGSTVDDRLAIALELEVAFSLLFCSYFVMEVFGGLRSPLFPLVLALVAVSASFHTRFVGLFVVSIALIIEVFLFARSALGIAPSSLLGTASGGHPSSVWASAWLCSVIRISFVLASFFFHRWFIRGIALADCCLRERARHHANASRLQEAKDFRLVSSTMQNSSRPKRTRLQEIMLLEESSSDALYRSIDSLLQVVLIATKARSCGLMVVRSNSSSGLSTLCVKGVVSNTSGNLLRQRGDVVAPGPLAAVLRNGDVIHTPTARNIPYYAAAPTTRARLLAVPIVLSGEVSGVVCIDGDSEFSAESEQVLSHAAEQIANSLISERVFLRVERSKYEHERFFQASAMLGKTLELADVMKTAFDAASQICVFDIAAITFYDAKQKSHRIASTRISPQAKSLVDISLLSDLTFTDNAGLVSMAVKNRCHLPATGELRDTKTPVFTDTIVLSDVGSIIVLPLVTADLCLGTLTLVVKQIKVFNPEVIAMLTVIATQIAVSLENGLMYDTVQEMATTDGLTGLTNHRTFQTKFSEMLARAGRYQRPTSVLLCDVDHFKAVNDTYGHPVGDEVLRQVAAVIKKAVREVDIPARYGGEEFAVVLEETDLTGAMQLAERIRTDVANVVVETEQGALSVTISIGVATAPVEGTERGVLIERADSALYVAKENGRDQVVSARNMTSIVHARAS